MSAFQWNQKKISHLLYWSGVPAYSSLCYHPKTRFLVTFFVYKSVKKKDLKLNVYTNWHSVISLKINIWGCVKKKKNDIKLSKCIYIYMYNFHEINHGVCVQTYISLLPMAKHSSTYLGSVCHLKRLNELTDLEFTTIWKREITSRALLKILSKERMSSRIQIPFLLKLLSNDNEAKMSDVPPVPFRWTVRLSFQCTTTSL